MMNILLISNQLKIVVVAILLSFLSLGYLLIHFNNNSSSLFKSHYQQRVMKVADLLYMDKYIENYYYLISENNFT